MDNPFRSRIVSTPWASGEIEVPEINAEAFDFCCNVLNRVRSEKHSMSVLLTGQTGSGKTHLLNRIQKHLKTISRLHLFLAVRLHTSPNRFWRHLRKNCVESLEKKTRNNRSQLDLIYLRRLFLECHKRTIPTAMLPDLTDRIRLQSNISLAMTTAFENLIRKVNITDTLAWLNGYSLSEYRLQKIGLPPPENDHDVFEDEAREFITELFRLAGDIPIVLCFDQIEALQRYPNDDAGLFTFGQAVRTLHNETQNLLIISCVQSFFLGDLKRAVMAPDFDGMSEHQKHLDFMTNDQAGLLISARLNTAVEDENQKAEIMKTMEAGLPSLLSGNRGTAREVLTYAAEVFDRWCTPLHQAKSKTLKSDPDERFLEKELSLREDAAMKRMTPDHLDEIIQGVIPTLCHIRNGHCKETDGLPIPDIDMSLQCGEKITRISLCNQDSMNSLAARLRRLMDRMKEGEGGDNLILIRHSERRIPPGAKKVNEYIQKIKKRGARWLTPSRETLSVLDAIRSLLNEAKSGDLNNAGQPVTEKTVRDWIRKASCDPAWDFVESMIGDTSEDMSGRDPDILLQLMDILKSERIVWLSDAAETLNQDTRALERMIQPGLYRIGYLDGPPSLLYDMGSL